jgi:hypothetical protein
MANDFPSALLSLLLKPNPSLTSVLQLFSHHLGAEHFILLEAPIGNSSPFTVTADVLRTFFPPSTLFDGIDSVRTESFDPPADYLGFQNVHSVFSFPISEKLLVLLVNPKSTIISDEVFLPTRSALSLIYSNFAFDLDFSVAAVQAYTENDMLPLKTRSFSVIDYHPSQLFLYTFAYFIHTGLCEKV